MKEIILLMLLCWLLALSFAAGIKCYDCDGDCADEYEGSTSHEQDCSEIGYTDDGSCYKSKFGTDLLGSWIYTGQWIELYAYFFNSLIINS